MECNITRGSYAKIEVGLANIRATEMMVLKRIFGADYSEFFVPIPDQRKS